MAYAESVSFRVFLVFPFPCPSPIFMTPETLTSLKHWLIYQPSFDNFYGRFGPLILYVVEHGSPMLECLPIPVDLFNQVSNTENSCYWVGFEINTEYDANVRYNYRLFLRWLRQTVTNYEEGFREIYWGFSTIANLFRFSGIEDLDRVQLIGP